MANTISNNIQMKSNNRITIFWTLVSDGSNETNTVIYNCSTITSALGIPNNSKCEVIRVRSMTRLASTATVDLKQDATTPVELLPVASNAYTDMDFRGNSFSETSAGGIYWYAGAGSTGNITITTTNLSSGNVIVLMIDLRPW